MAVVVTGASGHVGRALLPLLADRASEIRALVRSPETADDLRRLGAKVAVSSLTDPGQLAYVLTDSHTVCHLAGTLDAADDGAYEKANLQTTAVVVEAAQQAEVKRILFLSYPGASPKSSNAYLRSKGAAEELITSSGLEHAIIRCTHIYGRGSHWLEAMRAAARRPIATVVGPGTQRLAPTYVGDVAAVLAAADDRATSVGGTFGLEGPDEITADSLIDLLAGRRKRKIHLSPRAARLSARAVGERLSQALAEVLSSDSVADAPSAADEFGVKRTPILEGLEASR